MLIPRRRGQGLRTRPAARLSCEWRSARGAARSAFPDAHVEVHGVHMTGDVIVEEGTFTGTHHGVLHSPAGDIPPTGRRVAVDYIHVLRYRDGLHISFHLLFDRLLMLEQLGLVPAPAAAG